MGHMLSVIRDCWRRSDRGQTLEELGQLLGMQYELEKDVSSIENACVREYVYDWLDALASARRSISEDIRWDMAASGSRAKDVRQKDA
jgi:hypothetical protein